MFHEDIFADFERGARLLCMLFLEPLAGEPGPLLLRIFHYPGWRAGRFLWARFLCYLIMYQMCLGRVG